METFSAIAQIIILYFVIYAILKEAKGSRFGQALMGVGVLVVLLAAFTYLFDFHVLSLLVKYLLIYFAISTVVIFQPEIRRFLTTMGAIGNLEKRSQRDASILTPEALIEIILTLSEKKLGALFAFEQAISLRGYEASGTPVDAIMTEELLVSIFTPPLPLHDGGAVVRNRVKRIIRAAYDSRKADIKVGYLIVISARSAAANKKSTDIACELDKAFSFLQMYSDQTAKNKDKQ